MKHSERGFLSVLGIYAAGSWLILQIVDVLNQNLGLPPWAFSLALMLLLVGLPIVGITAFLHTRGGPRAAGSASREDGAGKRAAEWFTWRNAALSGLAAMALWGVFATGWLLNSREGSGPAQESAGEGDGPTGRLTLLTRPEGVSVEIRHVVAPQGPLLDDAIALGITPLRDVAVPTGELVIRLAPFRRERAAIRSTRI